MSFCFVGPGGSVEQRWIAYALLRDNVQHHLEGGQAGGEFDAIHSVAQALGGRRLTLNARQLHAELERAEAGLTDRPISDLAISLRTRAVIDRIWPPPEKQATTLVSQSGTEIPWLALEAATLGPIFGNLIRDLLKISAGAGENDVVEVYDL